MRPQTDWKDMRKFVIFTVNLLLLVITPAFYAQLLGKSAVSSPITSSASEILLAPSSKEIASKNFTPRYSNTATQSLAVQGFSISRVLLKTLNLTMKASLTSIKPGPFTKQTLRAMLHKAPDEQWCLEQHLAFVQSYSS